MHSFKDNEGRDWILTINVVSTKVVKALTDVDILELYKNEAQRLFSDPCLLVNVLYALCKEQVAERTVKDKKGVDRPMTDEDFGRALTGDSLEAAANALAEEVADFFPLSQRKIYRNVLATSQELGTLMVEKALKEIEEAAKKAREKLKELPPESSQ